MKNDYFVLNVNGLWNFRKNSKLCNEGRLLLIYFRIISVENAKSKSVSLRKIDDYDVEFNL